MRPRNGPPLAVRMMPRHLGRAPRTQALPHCGVFRIDGHDLAAAGGTRFGDDRPGCDQALLVREREPLARFERGDRRREPGEADDCVEHDVGIGMRGELGQQSRIVEAGTGEVGRNSEGARLLREQLAVTPGGEGNDVVVVTMTADDVEGLGPDGARGPQDHDAASHPFSLRAEPVRLLAGACPQGRRSAPGRISRFSARWANWPSTRRSDRSCVTSSTSSGRRSQRCSWDGPLTTSPPTSSCASAIWSPPPAWCCRVRSNASRSGGGYDSRNGATSRGSWLGSGRARRPGSSASAGCVRCPTSTSSSFITKTCAGPTGWNLETSPPSWRRRCGETSAAGAATSVAGCATPDSSSSGRGRVRAARARSGEPTARLTGLPGELLLYLFGRQRAAHVELTGSAEAVAAVRPHALRHVKPSLRRVPMGRELRRS